ncbi:MAG: SOS response-associated peptidase [Pseudomonadota bacterium]
MCGRYVLFSSAREIAQEFELNTVVHVEPRYNISPSQELFAVRIDNEKSPSKMEPILLKWGLIPSWTKNLSSSAALINARCETIMSKPAFRYSFRKRRILIPSNGFYEWKKPQHGKRQAYLIHFEGFKLFAFAGIYDEWKTPNGKIIKTCAILTKRSANSIKSIHDRMPVILDKSDHAMWLDASETEAQKLKGIFDLPSEGLFKITPVSAMVNNPRNESRDCIKPVLIQRDNNTASVT